MIFTVRVDQVDTFWPMIADGIDKAVKATGGDITAGYLWQLCRSGQAFLVVSQAENRVEAASVWRTETWSSGVKLRCLAAWGEAMVNWLEPMRAHVAGLQRNCGANAVIAEGREGWRRTFPEARPVRTLFEIDLNNVDLPVGR